MDLRDMPTEDLVRELLVAERCSARDTVRILRRELDRRERVLREHAQCSARDPTYHDLGGLSGGARPGP